MSDTQKPTDPVVDHLERLARDQDRATLALLRSSLQEGRSLEGLRVVLPFLKRRSEGATRAEDDALLVAGLFALHPESGSLSLASALRIVARESDSVELRFRALLGADRQDLGTHLRHAVTLIASRGLAIDWRDLHTTLRFWDRPAQPPNQDRARREWARDFWSDDTQSTATATATVTATTA
ncbi:MAG: type I-E CRISPR-associated protein Cse2/CasB [Myxococcales bacterium]|nr:type I-E CRISPR-associated protein Cse2/CasB [Myxococcales bacterium]